MKLRARFRPFRYGKPRTACRTAEPYSAESTRVLAAKYAALLRTTLRGIGHDMDAITIQTPPVI